MTTEAERIMGRQLRLQRPNDRPDELATITEASAEEENPEVSTMTMQESAEEA